VEEYSRQRAILDRMRDHHQRGTIQYEAQKKVLLDLWTRIQASDEEALVTGSTAAATTTETVAASAEVYHSTDRHVVPPTVLPENESTQPVVVAPMPVDFGEQEDGYAWAVRLVQQVNQGMSSYMQNLINGFPH
jgi:hypothetical protein